MPDLIKTGELKERMKKVPEWELEKKHIERTFEFDEFSEAIDFVNSVAEVAEATERRIGIAHLIHRVIVEEVEVVVARRRVLQGQGDAPRQVAPVRVVPYLGAVAENV